MSLAPPSCHPERSGEREPRAAKSNGSLIKNLPCHFDLVVTRLCCQHFAERQNARLARRLLLFPKISLRCDFREPCLLTERRNLARKRIGRQTPSPFMPSPFLRGKVARAALRRVTNEGCSVLIISRSAYHKDGIPSSGAPRQVPQGEAMYRAVF